MKGKTLALVGVFMALVLGTGGLAAHAQNAPYLKGAWYLTPMGGGIFYLDEPNVDDGGIVGGRLGYFFNKNISLEADFDYADSEFKGPPPAGAYDGEDVDHYFYLLNGLYHFKPLLSQNLHPFVLGGIGGTTVNSSPLSETVFTGNYGAGLQYVLSDGSAIRLEVRHLLTTDISESNLITSLGLALHFGGQEPAPPPPPPPPPPKDSDGDGVVDSQDQCPDTPKGCIVDPRGCPLDSDGDGVCDGLDQCPDTPKGARRIDEKGCSPVSAVGIGFAFDSATIKPSSYPELDQAVKFLKDNPNLRVEIQGHTDSIGDPAYNMKLSERRAEAVKEYLVSKGVPASQMTTKGYGATKPIADNATEEGRAMNRRIEYWRISE